MNTCPTCGNRYRPDIDRCPNDGSPLACPGAPPPTRGGAPASAPPPASAPAPPQRADRAPASWSHELDDRSLRETSSARTWIVALLVCMLMFGGFLWARERLLGSPAANELAAEASAEEDAKPKKKKKKKKRARRRGNARQGSSRVAAGDELVDYDWSQDFVEDDLVLGDILSEPDHEPQPEANAAPPPPPYEPTRDEWQPSGTYRPVARHGTIPSRDVTEIDLTAPSSGTGLDEGVVRRVLNERTVHACYAAWVDKIPQMRGRVDLTIAVAADGTVRGVRIDRSDLRSRVVEKCIVDRVRRVRFPRITSGQPARFETHFDFTNR